MKKIFIGILIFIIIFLGAFIIIKNVKNNDQAEVIEEAEKENTEDIPIIPVELEYTLSFDEIFFSNLLLLANQDKIDDLAIKFDKNTLTDAEKKYIKNFYNDLIKYGGIVYPEAGMILKHYIYGGGEELKIKSNYFFQSQMIQNILNENKGKEIIGPVIIRTNEDPRIGYTINGFFIKNNENAEIYQYIEFAERNNKEAYTPFEVSGIKAKLPHRLIRVFEEDNGCKGFTIRIMKE